MEKGINEQLRRYQRQIILPQVGEAGQRRIIASRVLVIGAGGLGSPLLMYLAAAGIGTLGVVDFDEVDESNLQRQILYQNSQIGTLKSQAAAGALRNLNPGIEVREHNLYLNRENILQLLEDYDIVADGSDNLPTRYLVNDACVIAGKPLVYGAIYRFEGQAGVFNVPMPDGTRSADYRDLHPVPPPPELVPSCQEGGIIGPLAGIIGSFMALETLKLAGGFGELLTNRICIFDGMDFSMRIMNLDRDKGREPIGKLVDYQSFCDSGAAGRTDYKELTPSDAKEMLRQKHAVLIDVREPEEFSRSRIGGINIPLARIPAEAHRIPKKTLVILACRSGSRSVKALHRLQDLGFDNLANLRGGLNRWRAEIDPSLPPG